MAECDKIIKGGTLVEECSRNRSKLTFGTRHRRLFPPPGAIRVARKRKENAQRKRQ